MTKRPNKNIIVYKSPTDRDHPYAIINLESLCGAIDNLSNVELRIYLLLAAHRHKTKCSLSEDSMSMWLNEDIDEIRIAIKGLADKSYIIQEGNGDYSFWDNGFDEFKKDLWNRIHQCMLDNAEQGYNFAVFDAYTDQEAVIILNDIIPKLHSRGAYCEINKGCQEAVLRLNIFYPSHPKTKMANLG